MAKLASMRWQSRAHERYMDELIRKPKPSKSGPVRTTKMDAATQARMGNGKRVPPVRGGEAIRRFGKCPGCGGSAWWDTIPAKMTGRYKPTAPDAACVHCGFKLWPNRKPA